ncbi:unnamed protein product [Effrenium voratum]|nr:unnamed protein product [Effrenium voratum]
MRPMGQVQFCPPPGAAQYYQARPLMGGQVHPQGVAARPAMPGFPQQMHQQQKPQSPQTPQQQQFRQQHQMHQQMQHMQQRQMQPEARPVGKPQARDARRSEPERDVDRAETELSRTLRSLTKSVVPINKELSEIKAHENGTPPSQSHPALERRLKWIEEDLQRNQARLADAFAKEPTSKDEAAELEALEAEMKAEQQARQNLEAKVSGLESTLMKERAERALSRQQLRQKYEEVIEEMGQRFEGQLKTAKAQLLKRSHRLEEMIKGVFVGVEMRLANGSFAKGGWVPMVVEMRGEDETESQCSWPSRSSGQTDGRSAGQMARGTAPRMNPGSLDRSVPTSDLSESMSGRQLLPSTKLAATDPQNASKALSEMLQHLHQENLELERMNAALASKNSSKQASRIASRNSPAACQTPGGLPQPPGYFRPFVGIGQESFRAN